MEKVKIEEICLIPFILMFYLYKKQKIGKTVQKSVFPGRICSMDVLFALNGCIRDL